jgi:hypothetical protein
MLFSSQLSYRDGFKTNFGLAFFLKASLERHKESFRFNNFTTLCEQKSYEFSTHCKKKRKSPRPERADSSQGWVSRIAPLLN